MGKSGLRFQICGKNLPPTHRSRDTTHAQWLQTHCQWYPMGDVRTHNSRTDSHNPINVMLSSNLVEGLTTWPAMYDHWTRSKGQRSTSQGHETYQQQ